jgi:hypothetical protein
MNMAGTLVADFRKVNLFFAEAAERFSIFLDLEQSLEALFIPRFGGFDGLCERSRHDFIDAFGLLGHTLSRNPLLLPLAGAQHFNICLRSARSTR